MADDEEDAVLHTVSDYYLVNYVDDDEEPVEFSELPLQWEENEQLDGNRTPIYMHGKADDGLKKIFVQVTAWKFDISYPKPEISVLSKDKVWINIQNPRKSFAHMIRSTLVTIHCLHYVKKNPEISGRSLWEHLSTVFSTYDVRPSEDDLADHTSLISEAVKRDETLRKAKFLVSFLNEKPQKKKKKAFDEVVNTNPGFIVDDDLIDEVEDDGSDDEEDLFDSVCSFCDNGGDLLCCDGRCLRSFHATVESGAESKCASLGLSEEQVEEMQSYFCKNCQYKQHQCFVCGELGSSDKSSGAEVFSCVSATCGRFYHPRCVAKWLHRDSATEAEELQKKIADGESFTCPIHKCFRCKLGEDKTDPSLQFAVCRRCPKSYHRKCLPRMIGLEDDKKNGITQRAWTGLLRDRLLIYCLEHKIVKRIGTPVRNHIQFPDDGCKKKKPATEQHLRKEKVPVKQSSLPLEGASRKRSHEKSQKGSDISSKIKEGESSSVRRLSVPASSKKPKVANSSRKPSFGTDTWNVKKSHRDKNMPSTGESSFDLVDKSLDDETPQDEQKRTTTKKPIAKELNSSVQLDADEKDRILAVMKNARASITMEHIRGKHSVLSTHVALSRNGLDKSVTVGKIEGSVEAIRAALQKIEKGYSIEDAKAVCEPGLLVQIQRWKNKMKVYLAPFLHGMRYTSFGRHFTKEDKLKEIVDMLHYYVQDDDMIVDFCCGSNDFSCLMKKKLDEVGKKCAYKNYDILQAKHDFNFEKRDWMDVQPNELPPGSQLIMGLNPPFGMNCALANKFIDKALSFKPKLIILIVPRETERLDRKKNPYDLIWEDDVLLAGKSFYFPGSVDVNDNQIEDWNKNAPPLSLWSRPDWTAKHMAITRQHGHLSRLQEPRSPHQEDNRKEQPLEGHDGPDLSLIPEDNYHHGRNEVPEKIQEKGSHPCESPKEAQARSSHGKDLSNKSAKKWKQNKGKPEQARSSHGKDLSNKSAKKWKQNKGKPEQARSSHGKDLSNKSAKKWKQNKGKPERGQGEGYQRGKERVHDSGNERYHSRRSSPDVSGRGRSRDHRSSRNLEASSRLEVDMEVDPPFDQSSGAPRLNIETGYGGPTGDDDIGGSYRLNNADPFVGDISGGGRGRSLDHHHSSRTFEAPSHLEVDMEVDPPLGQNLVPPHSNFETGYGGPNADPFVGGTPNRWAGGDAGPDPRNSVERFAGYERESTDTLRSGLFFSEIEDRRAMDLALRSQVQPFWQPEPVVSAAVYSQRDGSGSSFLGGQEHPMPPPYGGHHHHHLGSAADTSYNRPNTASTMQRYAPQLDELNHRMNSFRPPPMAAAPRPGYRTDDTLGFAPGPYRSSSQHNSSGWLND